MRAAAKLALDPTFQTIVDVLNSEHFMLHVQPSTGMSPDDKSHRLGFIEGYGHALYKLGQIFELPAEQPLPFKESYRDPNEPIRKPKSK